MAEVSGSFDVVLQQPPSLARRPEVRGGSTTIGQLGIHQQREIGAELGCLHIHTNEILYHKIVRQISSK